MKLFTRIVLSVLLILTVIIIYLWLLSPGKPTPIPGGISLIEKPMINGTPQGMIIRGQDTGNPILLYIHGGPGLPAYSKLKKELKGLEKLFTICYWEQRGAGLSYAGNIPDSAMTLDQFVEDAASVTRYLCKKFNRQKVYVLGHSWGTLLGSWTVHKYPELFHAYIGIGQIADAYASEQASYRFVLDEANSSKDERAVKELSKLQLPAKDAGGKEWYDYFYKQRQYVYKYRGARYDKVLSFTDVISDLVNCNEYTLMDKYNFYRGASSSLIRLSRYTMQARLDQTLRTQFVPVYIFQGMHDHQTDYGIARQYFDSLTAPVKKFYAFSDAAHSPHQEAYSAFEYLIRKDVLQEKF